MGRLATILVGALCVITVGGTAHPDLPVPPIPPVQRRSPMADIVGIILHTHYRAAFGTTLVSVRSATQRGQWMLLDLLECLLVEHGRGQLVVQLEGILSRRPRQSPWTRSLLLAESYDALRTIFVQLTLERFDFSGCYLIVLGDGPVTLATVDRIFHELWIRQIVNVVVAFRTVEDSGGPVQLWTYYPFSPGLCRIPKPHLLLTWPNDTILYGVSFYPRKNAQFHGCPLRVGSFETRPFTVLTAGTGGEPVLAGFEGDLLHSLAARLNFAVDVRIPPGAQQWGEAAFENSTGMMRMIYTEEVDLGISCLGVSYERSAMLKPGKVHFTTELVVVVPPGRPYTAFEKLFQPFGLSIWLLTGVCAAIGLTAIGSLWLLPARWRPIVRHYLVGGRHIHTPALNLVRVLLAAPLPIVPSGPFPRTLLLHWMLVGMLLNLLYQGSLYNYLQRTSLHPPMTTLADIDRSGAIYHISGSAQRFFLHYPERLAHVRFLPSVPDSIAVQLRWMGAHPENDGDVTMCTRDHVAYYNAQHWRKEGRRLLIAREPIALYTVTILYPKRSMLPTSFDEHIERIDSSGLLKYWAARYGDYRFTTASDRLAERTQPTPVSVEQLAGVLQLLIALLLTATLVFVAELAWARIRSAMEALPSLLLSLAMLAQGEKQSAWVARLHSPVEDLLVRATSNIVLQHYATCTSKQLYLRWEHDTAELIDPILQRTAAHLGLLLESNAWRAGSRPADEDLVDAHQPLRVLNLFVVDDYEGFGEPRRRP
uniref:Ionotropic glutamate receptor L-glutamate and glycine-binding domain-containing protein n=1 Tax=Anopheles farauti TaxID=69004 RepID=A0A182QVA3_9DIPT